MERIKTGQMRKRRRLFRWGLIAAVNAGALAILFFVFLWFTDAYIERQSKSTFIYDIHSLRRQNLIPNQVYEHGGVRITINEHGVRGRAPQMPKPEVVCRIATMGGSSVFDHLLGEGESWPERLAERLLESGLNDVESFNAGVPGFSSRETLAYYHDKIRYFDPDLVILYQGYNDTKYMKLFIDGVDVDAFYSVRDWRDRYRFLTAPRPARNWYALMTMWREARGDEVPVREGPPRLAKMPTGHREERAEKIRWEETPGMRFFERNVDAFVHAVVSDGAVPVLVAQNTLAVANLPAGSQRKIKLRPDYWTFDELLEINEAMAAVLRRVAQRYEVPFVDVRGRMNGQADYFVDQIHMSPQGSAVFAKLLAKSLRGLVDRRRSPDGDPASIPIAYWPLDESVAGAVHDLGPHKLDGQIRGGISSVPDGHRAGALRFNGRDAEIVIPNSESLYLGDRFQIDVWVRIAEEADTREPMGIVVKNAEYYFVLMDGKPAFFGYGLTPQRYQIAERRVPQGRWVHLSARKQDGRLMLFMDDEVVLSRAVTGSLTARTAPLNIGGAKGHFYGDIDEVRISIPPWR